MMLSRRTCLAALAGGACAGADKRALGQGQHRYRVVPGWGTLDERTPVKNCHGIVRDAEGHLILLTDHVANNVIVYDKRGRLVSKWGSSFPGAHGLSLVTERGREVLYITDLQTHKVSKTTLDGKLLDEWGWPASTGKYSQESEYKPSWTLHMPDGTFFVLDGYGGRRYRDSNSLYRTVAILNFCPSCKGARRGGYTCRAVEVTTEGWPSRSRSGSTSELPTTREPCSEVG
jgi:hypothetical protein